MSAQEDTPYRGIESSPPEAGQVEERQTESGQEGPAPELGSVIELSLELIQPDPNQPRAHIDDETLKEMVETVRRGELLQPIIVRAHPSEEGQYLIVIGHRRFRAHQLAGLGNIRAMVREFSDEGALKAALIENTQREDLDPFDEAASYERLYKGYNWSQRRIAKEFGRDQAVVNEIIKLGKLPQKIKDEYQQFPVTRSLLFLVARQQSQQEQLGLWERIMRRQVKTVAEARAMLEATGKSGEGDEEKKVVKTMAQLLSSAKRLYDESEFPADYYHRNPHEWHKLLELSKKLDERVESLRQQFGEPPPKETLPVRTRGRKPKAQATAETQDTQPMPPA